MRTKYYTAQRADDSQYKYALLSTLNCSVKHEQPYSSAVVAVSLCHTCHAVHTADNAVMDAVLVEQ
jgi:hypothetical protein